MGFRLTSAICGTAFAIFNVAPNDAPADEIGRYLAFPLGENNMAGLWIMDTRTGEAKLCFRTKGLEGTVVECTPPAFTRSGQDKPERYWYEKYPLAEDQSTPPETDDPWAEFRIVPQAPTDDE